MQNKKLTKVEIIKKVTNLNTKLVTLAKKAQPLEQERDQLIEELRSRCKHQDLIEYSAGYGDYDNDHYKSYRKCVNCGIEESGQHNNAPYSNGDYDVFEKLITPYTHVPRDIYYKTEPKLDILKSRVCKNAIEI